MRLTFHCPHKPRNCSPQCSSKQLAFAAGFSLIELLIVLGIFGSLAAIILPNLGLNAGSQVSLSLREFTTTVRATYDAAVTSGRVHRLVLQPKTGEYWAEVAPMGFEGRPPVTVEDSQASDTFKADARARLLEEIDRIAGEPRKANSESSLTERSYTPRSVLVQQRRWLKPIKWGEVDDTVLYKRSLAGAVVFAAVNSEVMKNRLDFVAAQPKETAFIYFFPNGTCVQASVQLATLQAENVINDAGPKFTVVVDALTGHSEILEGFQDAEFVKDSR